METFSGKIHMPGDSQERNIELEIDWLDREVNIRFAEPPGPLADWPGLMVQTIGVEEAVFRTKASRPCSPTGGTWPAAAVMTSGGSWCPPRTPWASGGPARCA